MADLADILGVGKASRGLNKLNNATNGKQGFIKDDGTIISESKSKTGTINKKKPKPVGMSREVYNLMQEGTIPSTMPTKKMNIFANKRSVDAGGAGSEGVKLKWVYDFFSNSARDDGAEFTKRWALKSVDKVDYPWHVFNRQPVGIHYSPEEYDKFLRSPEW